MTSAYVLQIPTATATNSTFESATRDLYQNDCTTKKKGKSATKSRLIPYDSSILNNLPHCSLWKPQHCNTSIQHFKYSIWLLKTYGLVPLACYPCYPLLSCLHQTSHRAEIDIRTFRRTILRFDSSILDPPKKIQNSLDLGHFKL